jgi:hypothetical protein
MSPVPHGPVFGVSDDLSEFDEDPSKVVEFSIVGYDKVPHPVTGERKETVETFHAIPAFPGEKIIAIFGRSQKRGEIDIQSLAKMVCGMILVDERDAFVDFIDSPNLVFTGEMWASVLEYLSESASNRPKELSSGSSSGPKHNGRTSTGGRSGRAAVGSGSSR